jgi:[protein-PII] uridylyltransferase
VLLDVRGELHRLTGRAEDVLRQQEQDGVAAALGVVDTDRDQGRDIVLRRVNEAARAIAHAVDLAWRRIESAQDTRGPRRWRRGARPVPERVGLAKDVVSQEGEVVLARDADPWADPGLVVRAARAAAEHDVEVTPISRFTIKHRRRPGLLLSFGGFPPAEIRAGVRRLADALKAL